MGIYISGMDMPKPGERLSIDIDSSGKVSINLDLQCRQVGTAMQVPQHGRLGDLDRLADNMRSATAGMAHQASIMHEVRRAPTVIQAEEGEG